MSNIVKIVGIVIAVIGFLAFVSTEYGYNEATMKLGLNVLTSDIGKNTLYAFIGEAIFIGIGLGIFILGIKLCHSSSE